MSEGGQRKGRGRHRRALPFPVRSADRNAHAAIGHDDRAEDEAGAIRRQEGHDLGNLHGVRRAADRFRPPMLGQEFAAIRPEMVEQVGDDVADAELARSRASSTRFIWR